MQYDYFVSLGNNCEIGLQLRRVGYDKSSFFRFTYCNYASLVNILENQFRDIFLLENLIPHTDNMVKDTKYNIVFHSKLHSTLRDGSREFIRNKDFKEVYTQEFEKHNYLIQKDMALFRSKQKILFFIKSNMLLQMEQLDKLVDIFKKYNPDMKFQILYITPQPYISSNDFVSIEKISKYAPDANVHDVDLDYYNKLFMQLNII